MPAQINETWSMDFMHDQLEEIEEIKDFASRWLWTCNHARPDMAPGGITPKQKLALAA